MKKKQNIKNYLLKLIFGIFIFINISLYLIPLSFAQQGHWGRYGSDPLEVFDNVAGITNDENGRIQQTELNRISDTEGSYPYQYKIANTLESIRKHIYPYLDWIVYIGTALAVILLIYNGLRLIIGGATFEHNTAITNIKNISIGIAIMWGFRAIIKITIIIINAIAGK